MDIMEERETEEDEQRATGNEEWRAENWEEQAGRRVGRGGAGQGEREQACGEHVPQGGEQGAWAHQGDGTCVS